MSDDQTRRSCGACTACCKTHLVEEISKPAGTWCSHCVAGTGCAVYVTRPGSCREFSCQWLLGYGPEEERPDRTRIVLDYGGPTEDSDQILRMFEVSEGALERPYAIRKMNEALSLGNFILRVPLRREWSLVMREGDILNRTVTELVQQGVRLFKATPP
jgi:hypothetical protein